MYGSGFRLYSLLFWAPGSTLAFRLGVRAGAICISTLFGVRPQCNYMSTLLGQDSGFRV